MQMSVYNSQVHLLFEFKLKVTLLTCYYLLLHTNKSENLTTKIKRYCRLWEGTLDEYGFIRRELHRFFQKIKKKGLNKLI